VSLEAAFMLFLVHTMAWVGEHRAFVVEEFIRSGSLPIMTQHAFLSKQTKFPVLVSQ
jgi:hypothetical protein